MTTIEEFLRTGEAALRDAGVDDAARQASSLLQFATARDRAFIVAHPEYELSKAESDLFRRSLSRRAAREPFQHITGRQEFYGIDFIVTRDVLIPRPETELIVQRAIELMNGKASPQFLEIGIGSGCISISILTHCPSACALGVDISDSAMAVARRNAEMHAVVDRLQFVRSDIFADVPDRKFDLIVSNPPYVSQAEFERLQPEVRDHDPRIAVTDGSTGLTIVQRIVTRSPEFLRPGAHLLLEIGHGQWEVLEGAFDDEKWASVRVLSDLQGIPRTIDAEAR